MIYFNGAEQAKNVKELFEIGYAGEKFVTTYFNKECTQQECHSARRSLRDLHTIANTYFPNTTLEEVAYTMVVAN